MRRGRACVRTARGVVPVPMITALLLVVGVMDAENLALGAGAKSGRDATVKAMVLLDLEFYPTRPADYCDKKVPIKFWSSQPSANVRMADDAPRTYHEGSLVVVCRRNEAPRLRIENTEYLSTDTQLQLVLGNASHYPVERHTSRLVMNSSQLLELSTGGGGMECNLTTVKTPNAGKNARAKHVYNCCVPTGWVRLEAHSVTTILVDMVLRPPETGNCTTRKDLGAMKEDSPDNKRYKYIAISLSILGAAIVFLVVACVCLYRRFKKRHVQLQDTQERLIDNVQELGHAVNPRPSTTTNQGRFGDKKRPRFGSQFFSNTPDSNQVSATSPTVGIITPSARPSGTPASESGFASDQMPDAKVTADDEKQASPALTPSVPGYSAYVPPTIASASGCSVGSNSGDTLGPLVRAGQRCTADGDRKSASADHATKSRPDIIQGSQQSFAVQSSSSERAPTLRSGLHRSESDRQDTIYDHVLGGQRQSNAALRRSNLILM